jgi:hypothetical protein
VVLERTVYENVASGRLHVHQQHPARDAPVPPPPGHPYTYVISRQCTPQHAEEELGQEAHRDPGSTIAVDHDGAGAVAAHAFAVG